MLTPEYLQRIGERVRKVAEELEDEILFVIILCLLAGDEPTAAEVLADVQKVLTTYENAGAAEIQRAVRKTLREISVAEPTTYEREVIRHYNEVTQKTWHNLTQTQAYEAVETYVRTVDKAALETAAGKAHDKAWKDAARALGGGGMPITTADGRTERLSTAIERNLRTSVSRLAGDLELESARRNGYSLVLVSAHLGARPTHEAWQGKVYSINGKTDKYDDFKTATGYGEMLGLCGINCRHSFSPWEEGMPNPYEDFDNEESRKRYEIEQEQRRLERRVRAIRRRLKEAEAECEARPDEECKQNKKRWKKKLLNPKMSLPAG